MKRHNINTPVKPHTKLRHLLVKPKDRIKQEHNCDIIYEIPCLSCNKTYIGETGRTFGTRKKEHQTECEKETSNRQTRTIKEQAEQENLKSAISDHCKRENHVMDWDNARVICAESNKYHRWIREATEIRKCAPRTMQSWRRRQTVGDASSPYCLAKQHKQPTRHVTATSPDASD